MENEKPSKTSSPQVLALLVGEPEDLEDGKGHSVRSAINKSVVHVPLYLTSTHFEGDCQADLKNHGGVDKAVLGYSFDHYPYWEKRLERSLEFGAFGENLTISGLSEERVHIGDTFQLDEAIIQVSQPRQPCFKIAFKHRVKEMPLWVEETGRSGIYFRVLKEGVVSPNPQFVLLEKGKGTLSLSQINSVLFSKEPTVQQLEEVANQIGLATSLREQIMKQINKRNG